MRKEMETMNAKRDLLEYYMDLPYTVKISAIPKEEGGGFAASIPELGEFAFVADGETPEEALTNLQEIKRERFESYLEEGVPIPTPREIEDFSGRFLIRLPKKLHLELVEEAKRNGVSLNQYVNLVLAERNHVPEASQKLDIIAACIEEMRKTMKIHFTFTERAKAPKVPPLFEQYATDPVITVRR